jgi:Tol biopolymer transport system component
MKKITFFSVVIFISLSFVWGIVAFSSGESDSDRDKLADQHFTRAVDFINKLMFDEAIVELEKVINLVPESKIAADAQYWIGQSYYKAGNFDDALSTLEKLIEEYPESAIIPVTQLMVARVQQAKDNEKIEMATSNTSEKGVIIDPKTDVKYIRTKTFAGKRDVIEYTTDLNLSSNGKFLLNWNLVVPMDRADPFDLVEMPAGRGTWSPDGEKAAFYTNEGIWVVPVSPETGQSTGPPKKLLDGKYTYAFNVSWAPDGQKFAYERKDKDDPGNIYTFSVRDNMRTQITNDPIREYMPKWSPDGKTIAYKKGRETWVIPAENGSPKKINNDKARLVSWSPDSKWLVSQPSYEILRLIRLADGFEFNMIPPEEVGRHFSWSPDEEKILFYRSSYDWRSALKIVSASGGPSFELGREFVLWPYIQFWSPDSKIIVTEGGEGGFWISPLAGGDPFPFKLDVSVSGEPYPCLLSPGGKKFLFSVKRSDGMGSLWVVPVSLKDGRTTGPAVMVFSEVDTRHPYYRICSWSPDGSKIAVIHKKDFWIASTEGGEPVQLTKTPEDKLRPQWLSGGEMISYVAYHSHNEQPLMVISASGGEPRKVLDAAEEYTWSPDGKEIAFVSEGFILAIPIASSESRRIADLKELGVDNTLGLCWSPDGKNLAFVSKTADKPDLIFLVSAAGGNVSTLGADDFGEKDLLYWSPDGRWISYASDKFVKARPEATIWEADFEEILAKLLD